MKGVTYLLSGLLSATLACVSPVAPHHEPLERFGSVTALIGGRAWTSSFFPDSVVAFYEIGSGHLQITGQEVRPPSWPTMHFFVRRSAVAAPYHLGDAPSEVHAEWITPPRQTRPRGAPDGLEGFISMGGAQDSLIIEELDLGARRIRARFHFVARELHGPRLLSFTGRVAGRILVID